MTTIAVVDYGMGNLRSVAKALERVAPEARVRITGEARGIGEADRVVFPGQGAMPDCMAQLDRAGLRDAVMRAATTKPLFGVCVGEQMLFDWSAEGDTPGLGLLPGKVVRFPAPASSELADRTGVPRLKVPHMGWNQVHRTRDHPLWSGVPDQAYFYFVHSYHAQPVEPGLTAATADYPDAFTCAVARDNIFATQFHPEKSAANGLRLYANFVHWNP